MRNDALNSATAAARSTNAPAIRQVGKAGISVGDLDPDLTSRPSDPKETSPEDQILTEFGFASRYRPNPNTGTSTNVSERIRGSNLAGRALKGTPNNLQDPKVIDPLGFGATADGSGLAGAALASGIFNTLGNGGSGGFMPPISMPNFGAGNTSTPPKKKDPPSTTRGNSNTNSTDRPPPVKPPEDTNTPANHEAAQNGIKTRLTNASFLDTYDASENKDELLKKTIVPKEEGKELSDDQSNRIQEILDSDAPDKLQKLAKYMTENGLQIAKDAFGTGSARGAEDTDKQNSRWTFSLGPLGNISFDSSSE